MDKIKNALSKNLKRYRKLYNYTQEDLAELVNVTPHYIYEIEIQKKFPSSKVLNNFIDALKIKPHELFMTGTENNVDLMLELTDSMRQNLSRELEQTIKEFLDNRGKDNK